MGRERRVGSSGGTHVGGGRHPAGSRPSWTVEGLDPPAGAQSYPAPRAHGRVTRVSGRRLAGAGLRATSSNTSHRRGRADREVGSSPTSSGRGRRFLEVREGRERASSERAGSSSPEGGSAGRSLHRGARPHRASPRAAEGREETEGTHQCPEGRLTRQTPFVARWRQPTRPAEQARSETIGPGRRATEGEKALRVSSKPGPSMRLGGGRPRPTGSTRDPREGIGGPSWWTNRSRRIHWKARVAKGRQRYVGGSARGRQRLGKARRLAKASFRRASGTARVVWERDAACAETDEVGVPIFDNDES